MSFVVKESKSAATIRRRRNKTNPSTGAGHSRIDRIDDLFIEDPESNAVQPIKGPPILQLLMSSEWLLFLGLLAFRSVNALVIQTSFVPDEYWQSLEVAHNMVYKYGYMTWEWKSGLRSYIYPLIFATIYKILGVLHLDHRLLLTKLPRLTQAIFAALGDLYLYKYARRLSGVNVARWTLLCQITSWFTFYCSVRTLTNSMETSLSTIALFYFPWPRAPRLAHWKYLVFVGTAVVIRPTAAILWLPLCLWHFWLYKHRFLGILKLFAFVGLPLLVGTLLIDRFFYGGWICVPYNFLQFNVLSGQGTFYGSHPWHWYITQGFPVILGTHLVPLALSLKRAINKPLLAVMGWTLSIYSFLGHKEFRFIFPILPMAFYLCGEYISYATDQSSKAQSSKSARLSQNSNENSNGNVEIVFKANSTEPQISKNQTISTRNQNKQQNSKFEWRPNSRIIIIFLIVTNLPLALYTSLIHQRGSVDVMRFIYDETKYETSYNAMQVLFLMPCHSTPWYSYVHRNVSMRFLTCEPDLLNTPNYMDEAAIFYQKPIDWLEQHVIAASDQQLPSHLVMFNVLQPTILDKIQPLGYKDCAKFFHSHVTEGRVGSHVIVMCLDRWVEGKARAKRTRSLLHMSL